MVTWRSLSQPHLCQPCRALAAQSHFGWVTRRARSQAGLEAVAGESPCRGQELSTTRALLPPLPPCSLPQLPCLQEVYHGSPVSLGPRQAHNHLMCRQAAGH